MYSSKIFKTRMKMKVRKSQRLTASLNESYTQLCCCIAYVLLTICLLESFQVDAYINGATVNMTNSFRHFDIFEQQHRVNVSRTSGFSNRNGRFLFDAFFGIDTPPIDASDFEEDDDDDPEPAKPCKCGKQTFELTNKTKNKTHTVRTKLKFYANCSYCIGNR